MKRITTITLLVVSTFSFGQYKFLKDTLSSSKITMDLTTPVAFYAPRLRLGYDQRISNTLMIGGQFGRSIRSNKFSTSHDDQYQFLEGRLHLNMGLYRLGKVKVYGAAEVYYLKQKEVLVNESYIVPVEETRYAFDEASWIRQKVGFNLYYGALIPLSERFYLEPYCGIGFRYKYNKYEEPVGVVTSTYDPWETNEGLEYTEPWFEKGEDVGVNMNGGVKISWVLFPPQKEVTVISEESEE